MADLFDYLDWRGDIPFSVDPFNEVDNLILAELIYTDFAGIVSRYGDAVPLSFVRERYFQTHSREALQGSTSFLDKAPLLLDHLITGKRFGGMRLFRYCNELDAGIEAQLAAVTFLLEGGSAYVAYRGTDNTLIGWKEDFDIGFLSETKGQRLAVDYLEEVSSVIDVPLIVGGHSKGGNFAVYASSFCRRQVQDRILSVYSNDGPGFREEVVQMPSYLHMVPRITRLLPDTSMIGMLLAGKGKKLILKSAAAGIMQHDGFTWSVRRNRFERAEQSDFGKLLDQVLDSWIDGMDDETRRSVTDTLFSLFESTGAETFHEMSQQKWKAVEAILASFHSISRGKQSELFRLAGELLKAGGQTALAQLPELLSSRRSDEGKKQDRSSS